jgi:hypothetical protein
MFAVDEAHALSVGWIAGRNTLLAALFSLLALHFHLRDHSRRSTALSTACVALALLSAEAGLWSLLFLLSAALCRGSGRARDALRALAPQLALGALWAGAYVVRGHGASGSSWYRSPAEPLRALSEAAADLPLWAAGLFGPSGLSLSILYPAWVGRLAALPLALLLGYLLWPALRRSRESRLFAAAALLALAPVAFTVPSARMLLGASFGACGWIALACARDGLPYDRAHEHASARAQPLGVRAKWTRRIFIALHAWIAHCCLRLPCAPRMHSRTG